MRKIDALVGRGAGEADGIEDGPCSRVDRVDGIGIDDQPARSLALRLYCHADVLEHGQVREDREDLERASHAEAGTDMHRDPRDVNAIEHDASVAGLQCAGQHVEERGLAGAIRPDDAVKHAAADLEVDALRHHQATEILA